MKHFLWLAALCWLMSAATTFAQNPDQEYVRIAILMQQAESSQAAGQTSRALSQYLEAQDELRKFNKRHPGWNNRILRFRTAYLADKIAALAGSPMPNMNAADLPAAFRLLNSPRPLVIGHRGYKAFAPENTLRAFELAIAAGVDLVELDYYHSKDGVPVVFHDKTLDRTSDSVAKWGQADLKPSSKTAEELRTLDAGSWFKPSHAGERIPVLSDALDYIQQTNVTLIERKEGDAATCVEMLREKNLINKVVVQAFDWKYLKNFHELAPEQVLGALGPPSSKDGRKLTEAEKYLTPVYLDQIDETGAKIVVWSKSVTKESVAEAHRRGYKVWIYTINDQETAAELLAYGVNGIITDNPAIIWKAIAMR